MKFRRSTRIVLLAVAAVLSLTLLAPLASFASSKGKKNVAIGLGVVSAYYLIKGKTLPGLVAGAGAYYMYKQSQNDRQHERWASYREHRNNRYSHHSRNDSWNREHDRQFARR